MPATSEQAVIKKRSQSLLWLKNCFFLAYAQIILDFDLDLLYRRLLFNHLDQLWVNIP